LEIPELSIVSLVGGSGSGKNNDGIGHTKAPAIGSKDKRRDDYI